MGEGFSLNVFNSDCLNAVFDDDAEHIFLAILVAAGTIFAGVTSNWFGKWFNFSCQGGGGEGGGLGEAGAVDFVGIQGGGAVGVELALGLEPQFLVGVEIGGCDGIVRVIPTSADFVGDDLMNAALVDDFEGAAHFLTLHVIDGGLDVDGFLFLCLAVLSLLLFDFLVAGSGDAVLCIWRVVGIVEQGGDFFDGSAGVVVGIARPTAIGMNHFFELAVVDAGDVVNLPRARANSSFLAGDGVFVVEPLGGLGRCLRDRRFL